MSGPSRPPVRMIPQRGRGMTRGISSRIRQERRFVVGHETRISATPKRVSLAPWITLTVPFRLSKPQVFDFTTVYNQLCDIHGFRVRSNALDETFIRNKMFIKFQSVKCWTQANYIELITYDPFVQKDAVKNEYYSLFSAERYAAKMQWARIAYHWPSHVTSHPLAQTENPRIAYVGSADNIEYVVHFSCEVKMLDRLDFSGRLVESFQELGITGEVDKAIPNT